MDSLKWNKDNTKYEDDDEDDVIICYQRKLYIF